jgi:uncharacterized integral membrane protein
MRKSLLVLLILTLLMAVIAFQNSLTVHLKIWFWSAETNLGLVLIVFFALGALIGLLASVPEIIRKNRQIRDLTKQLPQEKTGDEPGLMDRSNDPEFEDINEGSA